MEHGGEWRSYMRHTNGSDLPFVEEFLMNTKRMVRTQTKNDEE